jgi:hypothetical protein
MVVMFVIGVIVALVIKRDRARESRGHRSSRHGSGSGSGRSRSHRSSSSRSSSSSSPSRHRRREGGPFDKY